MNFIKRIFNTQPDMDAYIAKFLTPVYNELVSLGATTEEADEIIQLSISVSPGWDAPPGSYARQVRDGLKEGKTAAEGIAWLKGHRR